MCDHTILYDHHLDHHHFSFKTAVKAERENHVTGAVFIIVCHVSGACHMQVLECILLEFLPPDDALFLAANDRG
jgi:hypothetical protein